MATIVTRRQVITCTAFRFEAMCVVREVVDDVVPGSTKPRQGDTRLVRTDNSTHVRSEPAGRAIDRRY